MSQMPNNMNYENAMMQPRSSFMGRLLLLVIVLGSFAAALYFVFNQGKHSTCAGRADGAPVATTPPTPAPAPGDFGSTSGKTTLGIAYGTEKRFWLEQAARDFAATPEGKEIDVHLIPLGSLEAAQKIWASDPSIQVWSPASAAYRDVFVTEWQAKYPDRPNPILKEEPLALTPMVFVMWEDRYQPFIKKYGELNFKNINAAMQDDGGWAGITGDKQNDWGFFKFSHTHPNKSNSGLLSLVLMTHDFLAKPGMLSASDLTQPDFQRFLKSIESGTVTQMDQLVDSTGNLMVDMVRFGPSRYDAIFVYESTAIDQLRQAEGRWGKLRVVYPKYNLWNDNPYYVLDVPWSSPAQRDAALKFQAYLLSEPVQAKSMVHGFRPANTAVPTNGPDSPFVLLQPYGLRPDLTGTVCPPPRAEVINTLLNRWQQIRGSR